MEWPIEASLTSLISKTSPTEPRNVGAGAVPLKVHSRCLTPGATSRTTSRTCSVTRCVLGSFAGGRPLGGAGAVASIASKPAGGGAIRSRSAAALGASASKSPEWPIAWWPPAADSPAAVPPAAPVPGASAAGAAPRALICSTIPIWRWPTTVHQPSMSLPTTPTSRVADSPGDNLGVLCPVASARSWTSELSVLVSSITSRSPAGTVMVPGWNRMSRAWTCTVVVWPVAATAPAADSTWRPGSAAGSAAAVAAMVSTSRPIPTATRPDWRPRGFDESIICRRAARSSPGGGPCSRARCEARTASPSSGRKAARATSTRPETATRTMLGTGSTATSSPALTNASRRPAPRSSASVAARVACGPPPSTTGTRYDSAPSSTWAAKPTASGATSCPKPETTCVGPALVAQTTAQPARDAASQITAAATDQAANVVGGRLRASRTHGPAASRRPAR